MAIIKKCDSCNKEITRTGADLIITAEIRREVNLCRDCASALCDTLGDFGENLKKAFIATSWG